MNQTTCFVRSAISGSNSQPVGGSYQHVGRHIVFPVDLVAYSGMPASKPSLFQTLQHYEVAHVSQPKLSRLPFNLRNSTPALQHLESHLTHAMRSAGPLHTQSARNARLSSQRKTLQMTRAQDSDRNEPPVEVALFHCSTQPATPGFSRSLGLVCIGVIAAHASSHSCTHCGFEI